MFILAPQRLEPFKQYKTRKLICQTGKKPVRLPLGSLTFISTLTSITYTTPITFIDDKYLIEFTDYISLNHSLIIFLIPIIFYC